MIHKRKRLSILGESVGGVFGPLCEKPSKRSPRLHELWSEVTCPECFAAAGKTPDYCCAVTSWGFVCTKIKGHGGKHEARGMCGKLYERWPQKKEMIP